MLARRGARALVILSLCWLPLSAASADPLVSTCRSDVSGEDESFVCHVRATSGKPLNNISVEQSDGTSLGFSSKSYNWATDKTALYFVVQTAGVTTQQLERFSSYLSRAAFPVGKQAMGIATAGTSFREVAGLGSYRVKLESAATKIANMTPADGKPVLLKSLADAVTKLANHDADRKAIVVLADNAPSTDQFDEGELIDQARDANVAIFFVVEGKAADKEPDAILDRVAEKTNGNVETVTRLSKNDLLKAASRAPERIESGVKLKIDATDLPETTTLKISASVPGEGTLTTAPVTIERQTAASWLSAQKLFGEHLTATLAAIVLASGLLLIMLSYRTKKPPLTAASTVLTPGGSTANDDETRILTQNWSAGQEAAAVAWLDLIGSGTKPLALAPGSVRVGRSRDNDVQLTNQSVHRHHAILQVGEDGTVSIQDLGTKNGVFVNGSRCNECALCVDDVIELGEVKLRLVSKPA